MKSRGRIPHGLNAVNQLVRQIPAVMPSTRFIGYHFSDSARRVRIPTERTPVRSGGTNFGEAIRTVLAGAERERRNACIVITDGEPSDGTEALRYARKLRERSIDYTQILLHTDEDLRREVTTTPGEFNVRDNIVAEEDVADDRIVTLTGTELDRRRERRFDTFTRIAEVAGGNQVILTEFSALGLVSVELYDRYVGVLSFV
jgi:hypothetical protein